MVLPWAPRWANCILRLVVTWTLEVTTSIASLTPIFIIAFDATPNVILLIEISWDLLASGYLAQLPFNWTVLSWATTVLDEGFQWCVIHVQTLTKVELVLHDADRRITIDCG